MTPTAKLGEDNFLCGFTANWGFDRLPVCLFVGLSVSVYYRKDVVTDRLSGPWGVVKSLEPLKFQKEQARGS